MAILTPSPRHTLLLRRLLSLLPLLPLLALTSCYEDFDPNTPYRPVLCLNALITAGEPVEVDVTHTWFYTDREASRNHTVADATVTLYANGTPRPLATYLPAPADTIRLHASSPTYGEAEATVVVPPATPVTLLPPTFTLISTHTEPSLPMYQEAHFSLTLPLRLRPSHSPSSTYFHLAYLPTSPAEINEPTSRAEINEPASRASLPSPESATVPSAKARGSHASAPASAPASARASHAPYSTLTLGALNYKAEPLFEEHIGTFESLTGIDSQRFLYFTARRFASGTYTLRLQFPEATYHVNSPHYSPSLYNAAISLTLYTISESLYNNAVYRWQHNLGSISTIADLGFADPIAAYSNVSTGAGIVAARTPTNLTLPLAPDIAAALSR